MQTKTHVVQLLKIKYKEKNLNIGKRDNTLPRRQIIRRTVASPSEATGARREWSSISPVSKRTVTPESPCQQGRPSGSQRNQAVLRWRRPKRACGRQTCPETTVQAGLRNADPTRAGHAVFPGPAAHIPRRPTSLQPAHVHVDFGLHGAG